MADKDEQPGDRRTGYRNVGVHGKATRGSKSGQYESVDPRGGYEIALTSSGALRIPGYGTPRNLPRVRDTDKSSRHPLRRRVARIYIGTDDAYQAMRVVLAFQALLKDLGAEALEITDVKPGSILLTIKQWSRSFAQKRKVRVLATQLLQVAESMTVEKAQAENTALHSKSVAGMADSTKHLKSFSFDSGPLQYVQYEDENGDQHGRARVLNSKEIASNRLGDDLLSDPSRMFKQLEGKPGTMDAISD